jgi:hypothetical protein
MAIRKAGDSMLQAAYRGILKSRGYQAVVDGDSAPLFERLQADGSVLMAPQEMRETLADLKGRRVVEALQSESPARRIQALTEAIQDAAPDGAPMVFPVADAKGIYGASVIDGDRLVAHELANHGDGILENMVFVPTANNALTHVAAVGDAPGDPLVYGTLSQQTARRLYGAAKKEGYIPGLHGIFDEWDYSGGITPLGSQSDPYLGELLSQVRGRNADPYKLIIAGGRDFGDPAVFDAGVRWALQEQLSDRGPIGVVSGMARGADSMGADYARRSGLPLYEFPAQWKRPDGSVDRGAGYKRNALMAQNAQGVLLFPGGRGTQHMHDIARAQGLDVLDYRNPGSPAFYPGSAKH